jgi:hypothetical protein
MPICPKTQTTHRDDQCIWCKRTDLYPYGRVACQGTNCPGCGEIVWLCLFCHARFAAEYARRTGRVVYV